MSGPNERDALDEPLGLAPAPSRLIVFYKPAAFGACGLAIAGLIGFYISTDDRKGGEPIAVASIAHLAVTPEPTPASSDRNVQGVQRLDSSGGQISASEVEASSGVKVVRGGGAPPPKSIIIEVPQALGLHLDPAPDPRLVEKSRYGLLPRIGPDGARPAEVYARPQLIPSTLRGAPRVALVVGGLGLSEEGTANAIAQLPSAISLGFAPYGARLGEEAAAARQAGHETLLQIPMEPIDYTTDNPGPHTLLSSSSEAQKLDDLRWFMARFQGYAGVTNFLGAKFTADAASLTVALREVAARGLFYIDDGASPRSLAGAEAAKIKLPAATADVVIDAVPQPEAIDDALSRLEAAARANGSALGVASALPVSIEHIGRWARALEAHGLALTPASALASRGPGPAAQAAP